MSKYLGRLITTNEGVFVNVEDFVAALQDDALLMECAAMIKIAHKMKHPALLGVRMCILNALTEVSGQKAMLEKRTAQIAAEVMKDKPRIIPP